MNSPLPTGWELSPLGDLARVYSGGTPSRKVLAYWGGAIPWVTTAEIDSDHITSTRQTITDAGLKASAARIAPPGTILLAMYGQGKTRGKSALLKIAAAMNQACAAIEVNSKIDSEYLLYYMSWQYDAIRSMSNAGSQDNLSGGIVRKIPIATPTLPEQHAIAEALGDISAEVSRLEGTIAKKQATKLGIIQQLLAGRRRLPGFAVPWSTTTLGAVGTFLKGRGVKREDVRTVGIPCIRYGELYTAFNDYTSEAQSFVTADVAATALPLQTGDLLFTSSGETRDEIGKCVAYLGNEPAVAGGDLIVLRGTGYNSIYLAVLANMPTVVNQKARAGQGDAVVHISSRALARVQIDLPALDEQDAIASVILDADRELVSLHRRLDKARSVKQGMMQQLLTGRTRLPVQEAAA